MITFLHTNFHYLTKFAQNALMPGKVFMPSKAYNTFIAINNRVQRYYFSIYLDTSDTLQLMPRLFQLESTTGTFIPHEIVSPSKTENHNCPFPVLQDDLYNVDQPCKCNI